MAKLNKQGKDIETQINAIRSKFGIPQMGTKDGTVSEQLLNLEKSTSSKVKNKTGIASVFDSYVNGAKDLFKNQIETVKNIASHPLNHM